MRKRGWGIKGTTKVYELADEYLERGEEKTTKHITDEVWSDYTNMPMKYRQDSLAQKIVNRITYKRRK